MLNHDTQLFPHHVDEHKMYDFSKPVAEMTQHPTNPSIWGLKNVTDEKWVSKLPDGTVKDVEPGRSLSLATGTKILFGTSEGEIRVSNRSENRKEELSLVTRPGGEVAIRPLHFIWMCDCCSAMAKYGRIEALNKAIREAIPLMRAVAAENPNVNVLVRAIRFSDGVEWHISHPTPLADFMWTDLSAGGVVDMGKALTMVAAELKNLPMTEWALPPLLVMISLRAATDDFASGLKTIMDQPWGRGAIRVAIALSEDPDIDCLEKFMGQSELKPLQAYNPEALVAKINWISTTLLKFAAAGGSGSIPLPLTDSDAERQ
jgi:hypothetical protein